MTVDLSVETQLMLEDRMRADGFATADEALRAALQSLQEKKQEDRSPDTLAAIQEGLDQIRSGQARPWEVVRAELKARHSKA